MLPTHLVCSSKHDVTHLFSKTCSSKHDVTHVVRVYDYSGVRRWTNKAALSRSGQRSVTVLEVDRILIPVHQGVHWVCAEINLRDKEVRLYDSMMVSTRGGSLEA
jgi:Ulp1 family protease